MIWAKKSLALCLAAALLLAGFCSCEVGKDPENFPEGDYSSYESVESVTLPVIRIETEEGKAIESKTEYVRMKISVEGSDPLGSSNSGQEGYNLSSAGGKIRGRGNSTWNSMEKKSYRIKLDEKAQLLGLGSAADRDYVLLANAREKSMVRNWAIFRLGQQMGFSFVPDSTFVSVYLNDDYVGVYQLCEQVEVENYRVDLSSPAADAVVLPDTSSFDETEAALFLTEFEQLSFLVELDSRAKTEGNLNLDYFTVRDYEIPFSIKSSVTTVEQTKRIKTYLESVDQAILSGDKDVIALYVDLDSFVDMYLLEEFAKDRDVNYASLYFSKTKNGLLQCNVPWDFDFALGNDSGSDTGEDHKSPEGVMVCRNRWFEALYENQWFREMLSARWTELSPKIDVLIGEVLTLGYQLKDAAAQNYARWPILGIQQYYEPDALAALPDYPSHLWYLGDWMVNRRDWMDSYYILPAETGSGESPF